MSQQPSVRGKSWAPADQRDVEGVAGVPAFVAGIAAARGVGDLDTYFRPRLAGVLPPPSALRDMPAVVDAICGAVEARSTVGIIGDYDVDGATSTAMLVRTLGAVGAGRVEWRIPERLSDGYGPNDRLVSELCGDCGAGLLLVLDSGTSAPGPIALARSMGATVAVVDHHEPGGHLPDCLLVNPKRKDEDGTLAHLCTAGLAFILCVGIVARLRERGWFAKAGLTEPDLRPLLGLAALGTVADVVPLLGVNRAYVALGMRRVAENEGLSALMDATGEQSATPTVCGFVLGPCLNAAGRIADMRESVDLLVTADRARAADIAERLALLNKERREIQRAATEQAFIQVGASGQLDRPGPIVVRDENWHPGVVGLVASKLREAYDRPAAVIGGGGKGSARSVEGFDVGGAVIAAAGAGILEKGGGHHAAAGFTCPEGSTQAFLSHMQAAMRGFVPVPVPVDVEAEPGDPEPEHVEAMAAMAPFGMGNPRPRVALFGGLLRKVEVIKGKHVKAWLLGGGGETTLMVFNGVGTPVGDALAAAQGRYADVLGTLDVSEFRGNTTAYLKVEDLRLLHEAGQVAGQAAA